MGGAENVYWRGPNFPILISNYYNKAFIVEFKKFWICLQRFAFHGSSYKKGIRKTSPVDVDSHRFNMPNWYYSVILMKKFRKFFSYNVFCEITLYIGKGCHKNDSILFLAQNTLLYAKFSQNISILYNGNVWALLLSVGISDYWLRYFHLSAIWRGSKDARIIAKLAGSRDMGGF